MWVFVVYGKTGLKGISSVITEKFYRFCLWERLLKEVYTFVVFLPVTVKTGLIEKKLQNLSGHF